MRIKAETRRFLTWLSLFALAMAQLEAAVVVYLRKLYYPDGFDFPLITIPEPIAQVEIGREIATIAMLVAVAKLSSRRDPWRQYAAFLWIFGVWDIFYYVWLWVMLRWPLSLLDFDILFLIPLPWVGPVLAPVLISLIMIVAAWAIFSLRDRERAIVVSKTEWGATIFGAIAIIAVFVSDATSIVAGALPEAFRWPLFWVLLLAPTVAAWRVYRRSSAESP